MLTSSWSIENAGMACLEEGTTSENIGVAPGYWRISGRPKEDPKSYQQCLVPGACGGGNNSNCTEGYDGLLCSNCFNGGSDAQENRGPHRYFLASDGRCATCTTEPIQINELYVLWVSCVVVLGIIGVLFGLYVFTQDTYHYNHLGEWRGRQKYPGMMLGYFTNPTTLAIAAHFSTVGTLATTYGSSINFPPVTRQILTYLGTIFDGNLIGVDGVACRFARVNDWPIEPYFRVLLLCFVPVIVAFVLLLLYLFSVIAMWRLWVMHQEYYDEDINACCRLREREFPENSKLEFLLLLFRFLLASST